MNFKQSKGKGISLSYIYFIINTIFSIFLSSFIIFRVGKTDYGVYQSMTAFVSYLILLEFGTSTLMARNLSLLKKDGSDSLAKDKNISTIWSLTCVLTTIIILVAGVFYFAIDFIYSKSLSQSEIEMGKIIFIFASGNLIFTFLNNTLNGIILAFEHYVFEKLLALIKLLLRAALIIILLSINTNIITVAIVDFILSAVLFLTTLIYCTTKFKAKLTFKYFDLNVFKESLPLAFAMLIQTIVNTANGVVDKFLISIIMTPDDVSIYSVSMMVFTMFSSVATVPVTMFLPSIAKAIKSGLDKTALTEKIVPACRLNVVITGVILFIFLLVGKNFIRLLYGHDFIEAWYCAVIVIIPMFVNMFNAVVVNILDIYNKRHFRSFILLVTTCINIFLTIFGILLIGMPGAAIGTAVALILQTIILNIFYKKSIGLNISLLFKESFKGILMSLIFSYLFVLPIIQRIENDVISLVIGAFLFFVTFGFLFFSFGIKREEKDKILSKFYKMKV